MSRIGNKSISIPAGVTVEVRPTEIMVKGPKGELTAPLLKGVQVVVADNEVSVSRRNDELQTRAFHGLVRSLINNHVIGVSQGYKITLKMIGTGYRATSKGQGISMTVGFSHPVEITPEPGITLKVEGNDTIIVEGISKEKVGQMAANIRKIRPPEPYKGKGIRYEDEVVIKKQGKTAA